jgi:hypothetical protein
MFQASGMAELLKKVTFIENTTSVQERVLRHKTQYQTLQGQVLYCGTGFTCLD